MAMEILTAIIPTIIDYTVRPLGRQVSYVIFYNSNLKDLRSTLKNFDAVKQRMNHAVEEVEGKVNQKVEADVRNWQAEADEISREAEALLDDEGCAKTKCLYICPNLISYHQLSRKSTKLVRKIEEHENKKEFPTISYNVALEDISAIASDEYMAFESRISMVKDIITELKKPDINKIGVYGLPGVGKTTLAKEVYREAVREKLFDDVVIILNVKEKKDNEKIQNEITRKLSMDVDESKDRGTRASLLRARIKDGKTLVILDDVLERIDFEAMGLVGVPNCKLLLTSRERNVLFYDMHTQKDFLLGFLTENESWSLFEKMAGNVVKDNRILKEATQLAKKCGGLPVLVVAVASALRESSLEEWKDALRSFKRFDKKEMNEKAFLALKWSYEQLEDQELKQLFLLCGSGINFLSDLFKYSMGLGLIKNVETVEEARNSLNIMVKKLKNSCLLLDSYDDDSVRMHELVRDVAVRIASDDQKAFSRVYGDEVKEWPTEDFLKKCTSMSLYGCKIPRLPGVPWECPELKLLVFVNDDIGNSQEIPSKFFEGMKELKVLDVTTFSIESLPPSLQSLKHLHTLCLDQCELVDITLVGRLTNLKILSLLKSKIKELPKEIGQLTRLQLLDLTGCSELVMILPGVISSLTRLEDLRMGIRSFKQWEGEGPTSGGSNATVSELKHLAELAALDIHVPDANLLPANLFSDKLERYNILIGDCWEYPNTYGTSSNMLKLKLTRRNQFDRGIKLLVKRCEQLYLDGKESGNIISFLFDSDAVKQLKCLHVQNNDEVTYVINSISWSYSHNAFPNLESLTLEDLVTLKSVCYGQLVGESFQKLKSLTLRNLPKLIGFFSKDKQTIDTDADEIVLEVEVGGPPRLFSNGEVKMPNLTTLIVHQCASLRFLFSSSMAKCLGQLKNLKISNCQIMEEIVRNEENIDDMFDKLSHLELHHLPNLVRFSSESYIKFPSLTFLALDDCTKLETFIFDAKSENITANKEERDIELFDEKVGFPSLKTLCIWDLPRLKTIFHNQLHSNSFGELIIMDVRRCHNLINIFGPSVMGRLNALEILQIKQCQSLQVVYDLSSTTQLNSFDCPNLNSIEICSCESLKNVFPASVAKDLKQLSKFSVKNCGLMEEIVVKEEGPQTTYEEFEFPKVIVMEFDNLPQLRSFYPGLHVSNWPSLNILKFTKCGGVKIFAAEFSTYQDRFELGHPRPTEQPFFLIEKGKSFLNLEELMLDENTEIWYEPYGPLPVELLRKLKGIFFATSHPKSDVFFKNLQNTEMLHVLSAPWKELHEVETLSRVKFLWLINMPELIHLGMENSQLGGPFFPNLEFLHLEKCGRLENLTSSLISFRNLTFLYIRNCHELQYLIPYSVGKNLQQLHVLDVGCCERMVEIVASNGDDSETEITFSCLQHLELSDLPSLQGFCMGNCIFKVPSLETLIVKNCQLIWNLPKLIGFSSKGKQLTIATEADEIIMEDEVGGPSRLFNNEEVLMSNLTTLTVHQCDSLRFLFSSSMVKCLGQLKHIKISKCQALQMVYDTLSTTQLNGFKCPNLNSVEIDSCDSLKNVFPASVAKDLKQLSKLEVENCSLMEEIVAREEGPQTAYEEFGFPKVTSMKFDNLPRLQSFYPGLHVSNWPSLNILKFTKCGGVKIFAAEFSIYQDKFELGHPRPTEQPFFLIEKGKSFLHLEELMLDETTEIWYEPYGPLSTELLSKVKSFYFATSHPKSDVFFENLQNIEHFHVFSAPWKELFVQDHQGSSRGETHEVETLPRVKVLCLIDMPELIHLGMENSQPGGPVFPNLEFLRLIKCGRLENLASTLISFRNLIVLTIWSCHGLQYLIPYSVAKNLQQLKVLEVKSCQRMVEIVASKEDDPENEISFSCLQQLKLSGLPSLQGFCRGNCIFKVPSLGTLDVEYCPLIELKISPDGLLQSDPRPERLQIAEETDDVLMLSYSKENDRDQTEQLMIADSNVDVSIAGLSAKKESSSFA